MLKARRSRSNRLPIRMPSGCILFADFSDWYRNINLGGTYSNKLLPKPNMLLSPLMDTDTDADGTVNDFTLTTGAGITLVDSVDSNSQKLEITASTAASNSYVKQTVQLNQGEIISVSFKYKVDGNVKCRLSMEWYNGAALLSSTASVYGTSVTFADIVDLNETAPATCTQVTIKVGVTPLAIGDVGSCWINNGFCIKGSTVSQVPDPAKRIYIGSDPALIPNYAPGGLFFDASGLDYMIVDNNSNIDPVSFSSTCMFHMLAVIKVDPLLAGSSAYVFCKNVNNAETIQYCIMVDANSKIAVLFNGDVTRYTSTMVLTTNNWYLVHLIYDGANFNCYINDRYDGTSAYTSGQISNRQYFRVGARSSAIDGSTVSTNFIGTIGMVSLFYGGKTNEIRRFMKEYCRNRWKIAF